MGSTSRRNFLRLAGAGAMGAALGARRASAQQKSITLLHESSFIKPFDEYMQNTLAPAYEKETGVKIDYQLISVGSIPTRASAIAETGSGADITMNLTLMPFLFNEKYADVSDIAEEMGQAAGRLVSRREGNGRRQRQMEGDPVLLDRPADELAQRLVRGGRVQGIPRHLGRALRSRGKIEKERTPLRLRTRPRLWRQPRLALPASVVLWRPRGVRRRQDGHDQFRRNRSRRRFRPQVF